MAYLIKRDEIDLKKQALHVQMFHSIACNTTVCKQTILSVVMNMQSMFVHKQSTPEQVVCLYETSTKVRICACNAIMKVCWCI